MIESRPTHAFRTAAPLLLAACVVIALLPGCYTSMFVNHERTSARTPASAPLDALVDAMVGSFSSAAQAESDAAFRHVVLHMTEMTHLAEVAPPVRWLYVEQAMAESRDRPYRQRAYRVRMIDADGSPDGTDPPQFESAVFEFEGDPLRLAGFWRDPRRLVVIGHDDIRIRDGCEVVLTTAGDRWVGATIEDRCRSSLMGGSYATSEVQIGAEFIRTWDRGYDENGNQVWGSVKGPYEFRRQ